jgi:hypothetical protein
MSANTSIPTNSWTSGIASCFPRQFETRGRLGFGAIAVSI